MGSNDGGAFLSEKRREILRTIFDRNASRERYDVGDHGSFIFDPRKLAALDDRRFCEGVTSIVPTEESIFSKSNDKEVVDGLVKVIQEKRMTADRFRTILSDFRYEEMPPETAGMVAWVAEWIDKRFSESMEPTDDFRWNFELSARRYVTSSTN